MKHVILNFFFIFCFVNVQSQKIVMDSLSQAPISSVDLYSEKGSIIGVTDYKGGISQKLISKISALNIEFIAFESESVIKEIAITSDTAKK